MPSPNCLEDETILDNLCKRATEVAMNAYAPYSHFRVGAAVLGERGVYTGTNVENACGGLGICAERTALSAAIAAGERLFLAVAVACIDALPENGIEELLPCGGCRQWLVELAPDAKIVIARSRQVFSLRDLLPNPYRLGHWGEKS
jgi:cytidine deaminase